MVAFFAFFFARARASLVRLGIDMTFRKGVRGQAKMFKYYKNSGKVRLTRDSIVFDVCLRSVIV